VLALLAGSILASGDVPAQGKDVVRKGTDAVPLPIEGYLPSITGATAWLNSPPLSAADLRGKVVLVDVWTYSCINWLRTLPYVRAWAEKYRQNGLVVVGVHAPEFDFERNVDNVRKAAGDMGIGYPVAIDNDFAIWRALGNRYWPSLYVVDAKGAIRHHQFGEGGYEQSEQIIQRLLAEAGKSGVPGGLVSVAGQGAEAAPDWANLKSPENYVGYQRTENFASPGGVVPDKRKRYSAPSSLRTNQRAIGLSEGKARYWLARSAGLPIAFMPATCIS
jgi:thiol-disulfide isomerase/thioredoxin